MEKLFTLLELQRLAQEAGSRDHLIHLILNETIKIIPYDRSFFWDGTNIKKISGTDIFDANSAYAQNINQKIKAISSQSSIKKRVSSESDSGAYLFLGTEEEGIIGGVFFERQKKFDEAEVRILEELSITYSRLFALWRYRERSGIHGLFSSLKTKQKYIWLSCAVLCFFPVRMTITAPLEIVPRDADILTIPYDGLMDDVLVDPGDEVKQGDVVAVMEHTSLESQSEMTSQEMQMVEETISRLQRESLASPDKKVQLVEFQQELEAKKIANTYAQTLKDRAQIKAGRDGVAIFAESTSMKGKPLRAGDKVMMIADPKNYDLLVRVPVESMVPVDEDAKVTFFLNTSPFLSHRASIKSIGYQSSVDPGGLMTYKILARSDKDNFRIGAKGTAKIYGGWSILSYAILRRPLLTLRNLIGV